ncbi:hypothetical protein IB236_13205 [Acidovorax sp. ACV02]|uniref:hypothetical protein n=1 Tax=Acidovorax sp. ACV02 TaxID=2769310 RepID=UPI00178582B2|nr:hypothetical protein [Acidovorax sp. ACV02]MBD9406300.1 hypothetical protein [Acidovorax sp. ACV02]
MNTPIKSNLTIYKRGTYKKRWRWKTPSGTPVDLTGCGARMQIRSEVDGPLLLDVSDFIALGGVNGTVDLVIPDETTGAIEWEGGIYDLLIDHPGGDVTPFAAGGVGILEGATHVV